MKVVAKKYTACFHTEMVTASWCTVKARLRASELKPQSQHTFEKLTVLRTVLGGFFGRYENHKLPCKQLLANRF